MAVALGLLERVQHAGVEALRRCGVGAQRAGERVGGREADAVDLGRGVRVGAQQLDRLRPERPLDPRRRRSRDAVLGEEQPQRAAPAQRSHERTAAPIREGPIPGTSRSRARGSRSTTSSTSGPCCSSSQAAPLGPTCLTEDEEVQQRRVARRARPADALDLEAPAVLGVPAPGALDLEQLALVDVVERPGQRDLVAVVGQRGDDREPALGGRPAHAITSACRLRADGSAGAPASSRAVASRRGTGTTWRAVECEADGGRERRIPLRLPWTSAPS